MIFAAPLVLALLPLSLILLRRPRPLPLSTDLLAWAEEEGAYEGLGTAVAFHLPRLLSAVAVAALILAAAGPSRLIPATRPVEESVAVMLVLDVSGSMRAETSAGSALERTRSAVTAFLEEEPGYRFGLVTFAGAALTRLPPTTDTRLVTTALETAEVGLDENGSAVGTALALAVDRLQGVPAAGRAVILISDGDHNAGPIDPETAVELASTDGIAVHAIIPFSSGAGEDRLRAVVAGAGGRTLTAGGDAAALGAALASLVPELSEAGPPVPQPAGAGFVFCAVVALIAASALRLARFGGVAL